MAVGEHRYIRGRRNDTGLLDQARCRGQSLSGSVASTNFIESPCSVLHRRSGLPATGFFDETVQGAEDYELYLRIARHSELILHESVVAEYRLHNDSLSRDGERMMLATGARVTDGAASSSRGSEEVAPP